jgi:protein-disulfide isomerase
MPTRLITAAAVALLAVACQSPRSGQAAAGSSTAAPKLDPAVPVAKIGSQVITAGELDDQVKGDLKKLENMYQQKVYDLRKQNLDGLVRKKLVEQKSKPQGLSPEEYVKREVVDKVPEPTDAEAKALYERAKAGGQQLPPYDQVKGDIVRFVKQQKTQAALQAFYDGLMKDAKVEMLLPPYEPPKVEVAATGPSKGPPSAPITIVEFSDYQCPYCSKAESTVRELLDAYPGKIRLVYRDYPLPMHPDAPKASEAALCADDQGKYWQMHDRLFANQDKLSVTDVKSAARDLGLDGAKFDKCLDSGEKAKAVEANRKAGDEAGVSGTPAFFINGRLLSGAQPLSAFRAIVDEELARK